MLYDFQQHAASGEYDVCIVGAGPAGITLALSLGRQGRRVALLEGGGQTYEEASQALYEVRSEGLDLYARSTRLRYLGGTSNHWAGRCRPWVAADFTAAPRNGLPGWPLEFDEFNRFLPEATRILDLPAEGFAARNGDLPGGKFVADTFALSAPTRFFEKYGAELTASPQIDVFYHCNCVDLDFDPATRALAAISLADYRGNRAQLRAGRFVLALGAIENARCLLNSESLAGAGLPAMAWVGRSFMEHLNVALGSFVPADPEHFSDAEYFTSDALIADTGVGRGNISFGIVDEVVSYGRTAAIKNFFKTLACEMDLEDKLQFVTDFSCPGAGSLGTLLEQAPSRDGSRITLADERDVLGVRRAVVKWELAAADRKTIRVLAREVAENFARAGLGLVKLNDFILDESLPIPVSPHAHHMGTTRMAESAEWGVVDRDSRVFGVNNLYVAGASVFPTGGGGNPTMPLLQLTLRLGEHLLSQ